MLVINACLLRKYFWKVNSYVFTCPALEILKASAFYVNPYYNNLFQTMPCLLPPPRSLCDRCCLSVCLSVCLFVCLCVILWAGLPKKSNEPISLKFSIMIGTISRKNCLTFGGDPVPDTDSGSLFRFPFINPPSPLQNRRFSGYLLALAFLIQSPADFYDTWRNDWCRQENESTSFWERSGRHRIRIRIPDQVWLMLALSELCAPWPHLVFTVNQLQALDKYLKCVRNIKS